MWCFEFGVLKVLENTQMFYLVELTLFTCLRIFVYKIASGRLLTLYSPLERLQISTRSDTVLTSSLPCQEFLSFFKTLSLLKQSMLTRKHAGFVHTVLLS